MPEKNTDNLNLPNGKMPFNMRDLSWEEQALVLYMRSHPNEMANIQEKLENQDN